MKELQLILDALTQKSQQPAALATLVKVEGSSYRRPGARRLVLGDGTTLGSISGGCLEQDVIERARRTLASGAPQTVVYDTTSENDLVWGVGLGCQGIVCVAIEKLPPQPRWVARLRENFRARRDTALVVVHGAECGPHFGTFLADELPLLPAGGEIYSEVITPPASLVVFGAGDDAVPLVRIAVELGWRVTVFDSRAAYATRERFPDSEAIVVAPAAQAAAHVLFDVSTCAIVMTHRYAEDVALLRLLLSQPLAYLGVLGPRQRTERILNALAAEGFSISDAMSERLYAPAGLDIGGTSPEAVALSILAELQALQSGRKSIHLRDRSGPIHD